jgi:AcrR family transcriptional regulator
MEEMVATQRTRKERERELRRELLLQAAEKVFGRKPFDEASMHEVAKEAQIGMQGLYEQFPSKQALYESLILSRVQAIRKAITEALAKPADPLERLRLWAEHCVSSFDNAPAFFPVFLRERIHNDWGLQTRFGSSIHKLLDGEDRRVKELLDAAVKSGHIRIRDVDFLLQFFFGVLQASLHNHLRSHPGEEAKECVQRAMELFLKGAGTAR